MEDSHSTVGKLSNVVQRKTRATSSIAKIRSKKSVPAMKRITRRIADESDKAKKQYSVYKRGDSSVSLPSLLASDEPITGEDNSNRQTSSAVLNRTSRLRPASLSTIEDSRTAAGKPSELDQGKTPVTSAAVKMRSKQNVPESERIADKGDRVKKRHCIYKRGDSISSLPSLSSGEPITGEDDSTRPHSSCSLEVT